MPHFSFFSPKPQRVKHYTNPDRQDAYWPCVLTAENPTEDVDTTLKQQGEGFFQQSFAPAHGGAPSAAVPGGAARMEIDGAIWELPWDPFPWMPGG